MNIMKFMKRMKNRTEEGLTLVEIVLYLALFAIIFFTVMQFVLAVSENNRVAMARSKVERTHIFVLEHLQESFSEAESVNDVGSLFEDDSGVMVLNLESGSLRYSLVNDRIMFERGGVSVPLTAPDVVVSRFYLEEVLNAASSTVGVRITMEITTEEEDSTETIETAYTI